MAERTNKRKVAKAATAVGMAAVLLMGGTFAWQSISQEATNIVSAAVNPGGRLHDDFDGSNDKNIYVENFGTQKIFARIKLSEYLEIGQNAGNFAEGTDRSDVVQHLGADVDDKTTYETYYYGGDNLSDEYWTKDWDGSTKYIPTFNKDQDSLEADLNGTYEYVNDAGENVPYGDFVDYNADDTYSETAYEWFDADTNDSPEKHENPTSIEAGSHSISETEVEHTLADSLEGTVIPMSEWDGEPGAYWVYDTDGWAYWAQAIEPGTATGLLLDSITDLGLIDEDYYYAIHVTGQFITAGDLGQDEGTGFYADGEVPTDEALTLLDKIGVKVNGQDGGNEDGGNGDDEFVTPPTITYGSTDMPYAIPSGTPINLGVENYDGDVDAIQYYIIDYANNTELTPGENGYYTTPLEPKDGVTVLALEGSYMGQPLTQYFYGKEIESQEIASFSAADTSKLETVTFVAATTSDAGEIEVISEVTTKIYNSETHSYLGTASDEDGGWLLAFEALDESGNKTGGYCAANGFMGSTKLFELYPAATATWNEEYQWYDVTGVSETVCDGTHSTAAEGLSISIVETDYDGTLAKGQSITLKVDGDYSADDIEWTEKNTGNSFSYSMTENTDGTLTITHNSAGICAANGQTFIATLKSDSSVTGEIFIDCED